MSAVSEITELPTHILPEEHQRIVASTPDSFASIPPVLRHVENNVTVAFDPIVDAFSVTSGHSNGTLYVIESCLAFMSNAGRGFKIDYPTITVHAISRGNSGPYVYCQLDHNEARGDAPMSDEEYSEMSELLITPADGSSGKLEPIFEALSKCAALHPDADVSDEGEGDDAFLDQDLNGFEQFTGENGEELSEVGRAVYDRLEANLEDNYVGQGSTDEEEYNAA